MQIIDTAAALARALDQPLDPALRALLVTRRDQLGSHVEEAARFIVVEPPDTLADVEAAVGFPIAIEGEPTWEWTQRHGGGWVEIVVVLSDDGPADVVLVRDADGSDPELTRLLHDHTAPAADQEATETA